MRGFVLGIIFALTATIANAEGPAPEARVALSQNMDFYGSDLKIIFDTTYDACESACLSFLRSYDVISWESIDRFSDGYAV